MKKSGKYAHLKMVKFSPVWSPLEKKNVLPVELQDLYSEFYDDM